MSEEVEAAGIERRRKDQVGWIDNKEKTNEQPRAKGPKADDGLRPSHRSEQNVQATVQIRTP